MPVLQNHQEKILGRKINKEKNYLHWKNMKTTQSEGKKSVTDVFTEYLYPPIIQGQSKCEIQFQIITKHSH